MANKTPEPTGIYNKGFVDGCFDAFHYGHINALYQSKKVCKTLLAGSHLDSEIKQIKLSPCLFKYEDRAELLKSCRFIDEYVGDVPYNTTTDIINEFGCEIFFHGDDGIDKYPLADINNEGKLYVYNRTKGISTSDIIKRLDDYKNGNSVQTNKDFAYLKHIFTEIEKSLPVKKFNQIVIIKCCWDLFNTSHLNLLKSIKEKYPSHGIYIDLMTEDKYDIFNKYEMGISLLGLSVVDRVLLYNCSLDFTQDNIVLINSLEQSSDFKDSSFDHEISRIEALKYNFIKEIDIDMYKNKINDVNKEELLQVYKIVLKNQFDNLLYLLKSRQFQDNDMIVFDIDDVCLCNLMYYGIDIPEFGNNVYNYLNGMIPLNKECQKVFDFIHRNHIKYTFITSRRDYSRLHLEKNLDLVNLDKYSYLFTCPDDYVGKMIDFKGKCRETLYNEGWNIVFTVGDQISDITGKYTGIPILFYNPFYKTE